MLQLAMPNDRAIDAALRDVSVIEEFAGLCDCFDRIVDDVTALRSRQLLERCRLELGISKTVNGLLGKCQLHWPSRLGHLGGSPPTTPQASLGAAFVCGAIAQVTCVDRFLIDLTGLV